MKDRPICPACWHPFDARNRAQIYCSIACREDYRKSKILTRPCKKCGQPLMAPRIQLHSECRADGGWTRKRNKWRVALRPNTTTTTTTE